MKIGQSKENEILTLKPDGRLDSTTAGELETRISEILAEGARILKIDMSDVDYISSKGVRVLVSAYRKMEQNGMTLSGVNNAVAEVLKLAGLDKVFKIEK